jgi:hypothetical protein
VKTKVESAIDGTNVPHLFQVRNMFFFEIGVLGCFDP